MHGHGSSGPSVRNVPHPHEIHVHDPGIEAGRPVVRNLVAGRVVVVQARSHRRHVLRGKVVKEGPKILWWSEIVGVVRSRNTLTISS